MLEILHQGNMANDHPGHEILDSCQKQPQRGAEWRITIRGNMSLNLQQLLRVVFALSALTLILAAYLAFLGFWPILLIAAIQVVLVAWALFVAWRNAWMIEIIELRGDKLKITRRSVKSSEVSIFDARWTRVDLLRRKPAWHGPELRLSSLGKQVILGRFVAAEERIELARHLGHGLMQVTAWTNPNWSQGTQTK